MKTIIALIIICQIPFWAYYGYLVYKKHKLEKEIEEHDNDLS
jgi:hypothetical protein|nr:MAG TPA: Protein of unknown function (DUF3139) [Caudoviricetes sp.]